MVRDEHKSCHSSFIKSKWIFTTEKMTLLCGWSQKSIHCTCEIHQTKQGVLFPACAALQALALGSKYPGAIPAASGAFLAGSIRAARPLLLGCGVPWLLQILHQDFLQCSFYCFTFISGIKYSCITIIWWFYLVYVNMWEGCKDTVKMCLHSVSSTFHLSGICNTGYATTSDLHDGS